LRNTEKSVSVAKRPSFHPSRKKSIFQELTDAIVNSMHISKQDHPPDILGPILKPFTKLIIQIDKQVSLP
jgi:hypothetical protein